MIFRTFGDRPFENFEVSKVTSFGDDPEMIFRTFEDRLFKKFEVPEIRSFGDDAGDDFINFWRSTFLRI
jgi:hypothetical protein